MVGKKSSWGCIVGCDVIKDVGGDVGGRVGVLVPGEATVVTAVGIPVGAVVLEKSVLLIPIVAATRPPTLAEATVATATVVTMTFDDIVVTIPELTPVPAPVPFIVDFAIVFAVALLIS